METNKHTTLQLRWLCRKYNNIRIADIDKHLKDQDRLRELIIANLPEAEEDYGKFSTTKRVEFIEKVLDTLFPASPDEVISSLPSKNRECSTNLKLVTITRAASDIVRSLIVLKQYAISKETDNGLNLPQKVISKGENEPDIVKTAKTGENSDHYSEIEDKSFRPWYWMHVLNRANANMFKEKDEMIGKNQAPRNQDYFAPSDKSQNPIASQSVQIEKVAQDYLSKAIDINENATRKIKLNLWKKFFCLNDENESISAFNTEKEKTYRFDFEDGFFANPKVKEIITQELWYLYDKSSNINTFYKEENITAIFHNRRPEERNDNKIQLALGFSKNTRENIKFIECAMVGRKEDNKMEAYSNSTDIQFQKLEMIEGGIYGSYGYEGLLSDEEFEQKNLILWMMKNQLTVGDVILPWGLETLGIYSENLGNSDGIACKYNSKMTILDHPLQKDGEDSCLHCAFIIIALYFKKALYPGIIQPNTNLNLFLKRINLEKSTVLKPSLEWYSKRMKKEGKIFSLLGLSDEKNKKKHAAIAIEAEEEELIQIWHGWSKFPECIKKSLLRGNIFLTNPQGMVHEFTIVSVQIIFQSSGVKSRGPKRKSQNSMRAPKKFK